MAAYLGHFYEYRGVLEARLASEKGTTVISLVDETSSARIWTPTVELPSAALMSAFDTLNVDIAITCDAHNPFACSEWDRIGTVRLCSDGSDCASPLEIARFITPYWRRGRQHYFIDASPFLGLLRAGGTHSFRIDFGPDFERPTEWLAKVSLRLRKSGGEPRAMGAELAFVGGAFDETYNQRADFHFKPPVDATRVELVTLLTGHGQDMTSNCAEWCDHRHTFSVNGTKLPEIKHEGEAIGTLTGCASRAADGVIPGQSGGWAATRAYWCPGLPVEAQRSDITALVKLGKDNALGYVAHFGTAEPAGGDIALSAYVVWYAAP
jgi:hypothetical protein